MIEICKYGEYNQIFHAVLKILNGSKYTNKSPLLVFFEKLLIMFGLFKKKSEVERLNEKYQKLMNEAFELSKVDRKASDEKTAEANEILKKIDELNNSNS